MRTGTYRQVRQSRAYYQYLNESPRQAKYIDVPRDFVLDVRDAFQGDGARPTEMVRLIAYAAWMLKTRSKAELSKYLGFHRSHNAKTTLNLLRATLEIVTNGGEQAVYLTEYETPDGDSKPVESPKGITDLIAEIKNRESNIHLADSILKEAEKPPNFM